MLVTRISILFFFPECFLSCTGKIQSFELHLICRLQMLSILDNWLVVLEFNATLTAKVISWRSVTHVFPGFLTPVLTQFSFPKPPTTFLTRFCRGERRKYAVKKSRLNRGSNSQPPGYESNTLTRAGILDKVHILSSAKEST